MSAQPFRGDAAVHENTVSSSSSSSSSSSNNNNRPRAGSLPMRRRVRVLSLDGGGVRGLITLQILLRLEKAIKQIDPNKSIRSCFDLICGTHRKHHCDGTDKNKSIRSCFDLICGTSIGGIIAMALVSTDVPLEKINELFQRLPKEVFRGWGWWNSLKVTVGSALFQSNSKYSATDLERFIDETFDPEGTGRTLAEARNTENEYLCGFVTSTRINTDIPEIFLHRNYAGERRQDQKVHQVPGSSSDGDLNITIKEALRATSAAPTYFPRISIKNGANADLGTFVDGGFMANNPVELAVAEAYERWPSRGVSTILSIGTGMSKNNLDGTNSSRSNIAFALTATQMATDSQRAHARMRTQSRIIRLMEQQEVLTGLNEMDVNRDGKISGEEFHKYLAKFRLHKTLDGIAEGFAEFEEQGPRPVQTLYNKFTNELDEYHDFPEYFRLDTPHTVTTTTKDGKKVERVIDLGSVTLDTTDPKELTRMITETNLWLDTAETTKKIERIARRLTHSVREAVALIRQKSV